MQSLISYYNLDSDKTVTIPPNHHFFHKFMSIKKGQATNLLFLRTESFYLILLFSTYAYTEHSKRNNYG